MEHPSYNYKMTIAYDGTQYNGWQVQPNTPRTIQAVLLSTLKTVLRQDVILIGAGRTDTGVHALGQIAHFKINRVLDLYRILASLNGVLPYDIRIQGIELADPSFHSQYSAKGKTYHYHLCLQRFQNPFRRLYSHHVLSRIDIPLLRDAAHQFLGTRDFTSFANEAHSGACAKDAVRTIRRLDVVKEEEGVRLEFEGDGFLYKMVRNITGTLLEVAARKRRIEDIPALFNAKDRRQAGMAAPPHGLFLVEVHY